jgi:hypothetical protein
MNSLNDLNIFSQNTVDYTDDTPYAITVSGSTDARAVSVVEDADHTVPADNITISLARGLPAPIIYTLDLSNVAANVTCSWSSTLFPAQIQFDTPSPGVFRLTGLNGAPSWLTYRSPIINVKDQTANYAYTANLSYANVTIPANRNNVIWPINVTISNTSSEISTPSTFNYIEDAVQVISGAPQITDAYAGPGNYNIVITPNVTTPVFSLSSANATLFANSTFNTQTKVLTINGTKANVNAHLANITLTPTSDTTATFSLDYSLTNPISGLVTAVSQTCQAGTTHAEVGLGNIVVWEQYDTPFTTANVTDTQVGAAYNVTLSRLDGSSASPKGHFVIDGVQYNYSTTPEREPQDTGSETTSYAGYKESGVTATVWNGRTRAWRQRNADASSVEIKAGDAVATTFYRQNKIGRDGEIIEQTANAYNGISSPGTALVIFANSTPRYSVTASHSIGEDTVVQIAGTGNLVVSQHPNAANVAAMSYSGGFYQVTPDPATNPGYFALYNILTSSDTPGPLSGADARAEAFNTGWVAAGTSTPRYVNSFEWEYWPRDRLNQVINSFGLYYRAPYDYTGPIVLQYRQQQHDRINNTTVNHGNANIAITISSTHSEFTAPGNISATLMTPVKPDLLITDINDIDPDPWPGPGFPGSVFQNYTATFSVDSGVLAHGNISLGGAEGNVITLTNLSLNELNTKLTQTINGAVRYTPTLADGSGNGTANISIVVNRNLQDNTEIANITIPVSYTAIAQGATSDGGFYVGNLKVSDGFPSNYHLIARLGKTTTGNIVAANVSFTQFANTGTGNTQMIAFQTALGNSAVSGYDGQTNTTALTILGSTPQAVAIVNAATTGAGANASVTFAHDDWYLPSYEEALLVNSAINSVSGQTRTADAWTSTCPDGNSVKLLSGNVVTFNTLRTTTPSPQYNYYLVRRVPSST